MPLKQEWVPPTPPPQGFPSGFFQTNVSYPSLEDLENAINVFSLVLYWTDSRSHKIALQRSVLITMRSQEAIEEEIARVLNEIHRLADAEDDDRRYDVELVPIEDLSADKKPQPAHDSILVALARRLDVAKKSLKTGQVFNDATMRYCPHSKTRLGFYITTVSQ